MVESLFKLFAEMEIPGVNNHLTQGCCTFHTITIINKFDKTVWAMELTTEVGEEFGIKIYDTNQYEENPTVFTFKSVKNKDLQRLCNSTKQHEKLLLKGYHEVGSWDTGDWNLVDNDNTLTFIANHIDGDVVCRNDSLLVLVNSTTHAPFHFPISKKWFICFK